MTEHKINDNVTLITDDSGKYNQGIMNTKAGTWGSKCLSVLGRLKSEKS